MYCQNHENQDNPIDELDHGRMRHNDKHIQTETKGNQAENREFNRKRVYV